MKRILALFLVILTTPLWGQMDHIYFQTLNTDVGGGTFDYGFPEILIPNSEWRDYAIPIFEQNNICSYAYNSGSNQTTFTLCPGSTTAMHGVYFGNDVYFGETIKIFNFPGATADDVCPVFSTTSTTITIGNFCNAGEPYFSGSGPTTGAYYQWIEPARGGPVTYTGTWSINLTTPCGGGGGQPACETFFLTSLDRQRTSAGSPCTPNLRTATCYITHPSLGPNEYPFGVYLEVGPVEGTCSQSGNIVSNNVQLHSNIEFDLTFTSAQTPTKSGSRHYVVCASGGGTGKAAQVWVSPGYRQSYTNEQHPVRADAFGNGDQYVHWNVQCAATNLSYTTCTDGTSIETVAPPAGDGFVKNPSGAALPLAVVHTGTTAHGIRIEACADADLTACDHVRWWVSSATKPLANADLVEQVPCEMDPVMAAAGGNTYTAGPTHTYPLPKDMPTQSYPWGSLFQFFNEGAAGSPTVFHNYVQWNIPTNWASFTTNIDVPSLYICGVPNATTGELPIVDGDHAYGSSNVGEFTGQDNLFTVNGAKTSGGTLRSEYTGVIQPMHRASIAAFYFQHANPNYFFYSPGVTPPCDGCGGPYEDANSTRFNASQQFSVIGTHTFQVANPFFADCNIHGGFYKNCDLDSWAEGNHFEGYSLPGRSTEHAVYDQSFRNTMILNYLDGGYGTDATGFCSFRGTRVLVLYNRMVGKDGTYDTGSLMCGSSEIQDSNEYFNINYAFGRPPGWDGIDCGGQFYTPYCTDSNGPAAFGGMDSYGAMAAEHWNSLYVIGNVVHQVTGECAFVIPQTHGLNGLEMAHNLYYYSNTMDCPNLANFGYYEDVRPPFGNNFFADKPQEWPFAEFGNNMLYGSANATDGDCNHGMFQGVRNTGKVNYLHNVIETGQLALTNSNIPMNYWGGLAFCQHSYGIQPQTSTYQFTGMDPMNIKIGGWNPSNFIQTSTKPYNSTTFVPPNSSPGVGFAVPPPYPALLYPTYFNPPDAAGNVTRRVQVDSNNYATTVGAFDSGGGPTPVSIAITPSPISLTFPSSTPIVCTTTLSDSSTRNCSAPSCISTNTAAATVTGLTVTAVNAGSGNISCTAETLTAPNVPFTVTRPSTSQENGRFKMNDNFKVIPH